MEWRVHDDTIIALFRPVGRGIFPQELRTGIGDIQAGAIQRQAFRLNQVKRFDTSTRQHRPRKISPASTQISHAGRQLCRQGFDQQLGPCINRTVRKHPCGRDEPMITLCRGRCRPISESISGIEPEQTTMGLCDRRNIAQHLTTGFKQAVDAIGLGTIHDDQL